jgi:putative ABC transport system substrate-binding protein
MPFVALGQQTGRVYRLGILEAVPATRNGANLDSLRKGLRDLGYIEGQNLLIEYRSADGRAEGFPELAFELVRLKPDLILTRGTPAAQAVRNATETIRQSWQRWAIQTALSPALRVQGQYHWGDNL